MKSIKNLLFYSMVLLSTGLSGCFAIEEVVQPISVSGLELIAGSIVSGERVAYVSASSSGYEVPLAWFGLEIDVVDWELVGDEIEGSNTFVSTNKIASFSITSDSTIQVTQDSVYASGEELKGLFMTDRVGRSYFEPIVGMERMVGRNLRLSAMVMQMVSPLERDLDQTFTINIVMDDGDEYTIQSNRVKVKR